MHEAEEAGGKFPISCTIQIQNPQTENWISISSECSGFAPILQATEVGESVTKIPNEYIFQYHDTKIAIIDTPGLLATEDVGKHTHDTDKENVNNILKLLSAYNEIHAICIFLKANETRLSDALQYTITEIFRHLDKNASNNVIFIFTYAASTRFKPDTQPILEKFLAEKKLPIPLPPHERTVYCFESDSLRYLIERRNKIPLDADADDEEHVTKSWKRSKKSTADMIGYVCSLKPLPLDGINAIYDAECTISILSKLVLAILQCIAENVSELERKKKEAEEMKGKITSGRAKFEQSHVRTLTYVDKKRVERKELGYVMVVCEGAKCVKFVDGEPVYEQICCRRCSTPFMYFCESMDWRGNCKRCGCDKGKHEWSSTESKIVTEKVPLVQEKVEIGQAAETFERDKVVETIDKAIWECEERVKSNKREAEQMLRTCAKLNAYVNRNALVASFCDDELTRTLENRIETYKSAVLGKGLTDLRRIRLEYEGYLKEEEFHRYNPSDVQQLIQQLYSLPVNGSDLKNAMDVEERARRRVADVKRKANPVMVLAEFCGQFISTVKTTATWLYRRTPDST